MLNPYEYLYIRLMTPYQNPYELHLIPVNFDSSHLTTINPYFHHMKNPYDPFFITMNFPMNSTRLIPSQAGLPG